MIIEYYFCLKCTSLVTRAQAKQLVQVSQPQEIEPDILQEMPFSSEASVSESRPTEQERMQKCSEWVEGLLETSGQAEEGTEEPELAETDRVIPSDLSQLQHEDSTLTECFKKADENKGVVSLLGKTFVVENGLLYRQSKEDGLQLVVPKAYRKEVLEPGHSIP